MSEIRAQSNDVDTVRQLAELHNERAELKQADKEWSGWGASARSQRIVEIDRAIEALVFEARAGGQKPPADASEPEAPADSAGGKRTPLETARAKMKAINDETCAKYPVIDVLTKAAAELAMHLMMFGDDIKPTTLMKKFPEIMLEVATALLMAHAPSPEFTPEEQAALTQELENNKQSKA